jgi:hypothetical protein
MTEERQASNGPSTAVDPNSSGVRMLALSRPWVSSSWLIAAGHQSTAATGGFLVSHLVDRK